MITSFSVNQGVNGTKCHNEKNMIVTQLEISLKFGHSKKIRIKTQLIMIVKTNHLFEDIGLEAGMQP